MANYRKGDINMDGLINQADLDLLTAYIEETATLTEEQIALADLNNDGKANLKDMNILYELVKSENAVFGFKKNGTRVEVPTKEDLDNLDVDIEINVIDNLTSTSTTDPLSANQGKVLNDKINNLNIPAATTVTDNLTSNSATAALSANQGRVLNEKIDNLDIPDAVTIVDNVSSTSTTSALSANQGKILNEKIEEIKNQPELIEFLLSVTDQGNNKFHKCTAEKGMTFGEWIASSYYDSSCNLSFYEGQQLVSTNLWTYYSIINKNSIDSYVFAADVIFPYGVYTGRSCCCFEAGTKVLMSLEGETKNIEDIQPGDQVISYDLETGKFYLTEVNKLITNNMVTDVAEIILENDDKVRMNAYHPILTTNGYHSLTNHEGFETLVTDDIIITKNGNFKIKEIIRYTQEPEEMYNLNINDKNHNYVANNMVVHNAGCK